MKSYTDIKQSKKLEEILPVESADMMYKQILPKSDRISHVPVIGNPLESLKWYNKGYTYAGQKALSIEEYCIPCWSLAALLNVLPSSTLDSSDDHHYRLHCMERFTEWYDNPIDACYEMIIQLKEKGLL